jgi:ATP adenylyltransferase
MDYITKKKARGCFLCDTLSNGKDEDKLVLFRGIFGFVMMNKFPYNNGHLLVVPNRHCLDLEQLRDEEIFELFRLTKFSAQVLKASFHPQGFNIGINIGVEAGAGEEHLHVHIVPRWVGDTNFMPVLGETKVIPEYLKKTYQRLRRSFKDLSKEVELKKGGRRA